MRSTRILRIMKSVLDPPPNDCVPMSNQARARARDDGGGRIIRILRMHDWAFPGTEALFDAGES
jgi:hypothetical protein